jgi:hypothetical protein
MSKELFLTDDTALAAYLYLCGMEFVEGTLLTSPTERRKKYVIFDTKNRPKLEEDFYCRRTAVAPLDYHDARVKVSRFLKKTYTDPSEVL